MKPTSILVCCALLTVPLSSALAQPTKAGVDAARYEARRLADEGQSLFEAGDYRGAIARLREADAKFPAPTLKLAWAEAHEKLAQLLEARAVYAKIAEEKLDRFAPAEFHEAVATAKAALARLDEAIPRLAVELVGPPPPMLSLTLDGVALSTSDRPISVNPGKHTLSIEMSGQPPETRSLDLKEKETRRIQIRWAATTATAAAKSSPPGTAAQGRSRSMVAPVLAFGVGGAGLVLGAVTGGIAMSKMDGFRQLCGPELQCPESVSGDLEGAKVAGHVSTVGFAVAGAGAALGALLLVLPGKKGGPASVAVGPSGIVVTGTF